MSNLKRRIVKCIIPGGAPDGKDLEDRGYFECWGTDILYTENHCGDIQSYIPYTVAIVTLGDGKVVCVPPQKITFIGEE